MPTLAYKFRAYTDEQTMRELKSQLVLLCEVYNTLRWADTYFYQRDGRGLSKNELRQTTLDLRKQDREYQRVYAQVVQEVADRYYEARQRFFEGVAKFPKEKKPHKWLSLTYPQQGWKVLSVRPIRSRKKKLIKLQLSKLGVFDVIVHRRFDFEKVKRVTVKLTKSGEVYIIFTLEDVEVKPLPSVGMEVGIDVGIEKLLVTSDGEYVPNLRPLERAMDRIKRLQKSMSRKKYLSKNWFKAKQKLAKAYEHLNNLKRDLYMKIGKYLASKYDIVVMEDIDVRKLSDKSDRSMRKRLKDVSFGMLKKVIKYQVTKYGKTFKTVSPAYTSKTCFKCGYRNDALTLKDRVFTCPKCGFTCDRDLNASLNILKRSGTERAFVPVELRPLPVVKSYGQVSTVKQEAPSFRRE